MSSQCEEFCLSARQLISTVDTKGNDMHSCPDHQYQDVRCSSDIMWVMQLKKCFHVLPQQREVSLHLLHTYKQQLAA
eukprot:3983242-Amphidinium_carterae.1